MIEATRSGVVRMISSAISFVLILIVLLPAIWANGASAQSDTGLVSDNEYELLAGGSVIWDEPWTVVEEGTGFTEDLLGDYIVLQSGDEAFIDLFTTPAVGSTASNLEWITAFTGTNYPDSELLETTSNKQAGHSVVRFTDNDTVYGAYVHVSATDDLATLIAVILVGPGENFGELIEDINDTIAIDEEPLLASADPAEIQALIDDGEAMPFPGEEAPVDVDDADQPPSDANDDRKLPEDDESDDPESTATPDNETPEADEDEETPADDEEIELDPAWEDAGLVSETEYESPQYGFIVEWSEPWELDDYYETDEDDETFTVFSDEDSGVDEVNIWVTDTTGLLKIDGSLTEGDTAADIVEFWESDDYLEGLDDPDAELLLSDGDEETGAAVFLWHASDGTEFVLYNEVTLIDDGDAKIRLFLSATPEEFMEMLGEAQDGIEIDGAAGFAVLDDADIEEVVGDI